jgi:hypothetical protein
MMTKTMEHSYDVNKKKSQEKIVCRSKKKSLLYDMKKRKLFSPKVCDFFFASFVSPVFDVGNISVNVCNMNQLKKRASMGHQIAPLFFLVVARLYILVLSILFFGRVPIQRNFSKCIFKFGLNKNVLLFLLRLFCAVLLCVRVVLLIIIFFFFLLFSVWSTSLASFILFFLFCFLLLEWTGRRDCSVRARGYRTKQEMKEVQ